MKPIAAMTEAEIDAEILELTPEQKLNGMLSKYEPHEIILAALGGDPLSFKWKKKRHRISKKARERARKFGEESETAGHGDAKDIAEKMLRLGEPVAGETKEARHSRLLARGLWTYKNHKRGAPVKFWRKVMRDIVAERIEKFPEESNTDVADLLLANYKLRGALGKTPGLETVRQYVSAIRVGGVGIGRKK